MQVISYNGPTSVDTVGSHLLKGGSMATVTTITVGSNNWVNKANSAIDKGKRIKLKIVGMDAFTLGEALKRQITGTPKTLEPVTTIAVTSAIVVGVIAVVGLGVMAAVCLYGISKGYTIVATHRTRGPNPFDDELTFDLKPPA
jgi:hypothetical protein